MRRRHLLSLLAAGAGTVAGCSGSDDRDAGTVTPAAVPTVSASRSPPPERGTTDRGLGAARRSDVVESPDLDRTFAVTVDALRSPDADTPDLAVRFTGAATDRRPARLAGTVANRSTVAFSVDPSRLPLLGAVPEASPVDGAPAESLVLAPTPGHELGVRSPPVERTAEGRWRLSSPLEGPLVRTRPVRLSPGERLRFAYRLVGRHGGSGFPTGEYRFGRGDLAATVATWRTSRPGPADASLFVDPDLPPLPGLGTVSWYHDAGPRSGLFLRPSTERTDLPATVTYRLVNRARALAGTRWLFLKLVDGAWFELAPDGRYRYRGLLRIGTSESWTLSLRHGAPGDAAGPGWLGGGRYAFVADVGYSDETHAALLDVDAPPLTVAPGEGVDVARDGPTATVTHPTWAGEADPGSGTVTLSRATAADRRLIPEQVLRDPVLRNTLAVAADVETVVFRAGNGVLDGWDDGASSFRFRDRAYRIGVDRPS